MRNNKSSAKILLICLGIGSFLIACNGSIANIKYINSNKILQEYHGASIQHELFQAKTQDWQQRVDSLNTELQALSKVPTATRAIKEKQILHYREAIQQQAQQENQRLTKAVLEEINAYLKQYGKERGYIFILGATESGNIVYAADGTDITEEVLKGLNAQYDRQHPSAAH